MHPLHFDYIGFKVVSSRIILQCNHLFYKNYTLTLLTEWLMNMRLVFFLYMSGVGAEKAI
jgi:hypothetical protein